jgi:hypothetical protein
MRKCPGEPPFSDDELRRVLARRTASRNTSACRSPIADRLGRRTGHGRKACAQVLRGQLAVVTLHPPRPDLVRQRVGDLVTRHQDRAAQGEGEQHRARVVHLVVRQHHELGARQLGSQGVVRDVLEPMADPGVAVRGLTDELAERLGRRPPRHLQAHSVVRDLAERRHQSLEPLVGPQQAEGQDAPGFGRLVTDPVPVAIVAVQDGGRRLGARRARVEPDPPGRPAVAQPHH